MCQHTDAAATNVAGMFIAVTWDYHVALPIAAVSDGAYLLCPVCT